MRWDVRFSSLLLLCLGAAMLSSGYILSHPQMWTKLILTHHWPQTFCKMEACQTNISYWTLHGLWPDKGMLCNNSWPFDPSEIEDLMPDMEKSWPDLLRPSALGFWKYEWHKHGTCAAQSASLDSQHKYFGKALELYHKIDLHGVLKMSNIIPSDTTYAFSDIDRAIENFYSAKPKIQCLHPQRHNNMQILGQIEICFDPNFTLVDCEVHVTMETKRPHMSGFSVCDHDVPVLYPSLS